MVLSCVGEVSHVSFEDDGASSGERGGILYVLAEFAGLLDGHAEALDELHEEVSCAL